MMLDFPANPIDAQLFNAPNGITYQWSAEHTAWLPHGIGPPLVIVGDSVPAAAAQGQLWWHKVFGQLFIFYDDGDSAQWVPASPAVWALQIAPGTVADFAGEEAPSGWYLCDGALKNRILDARLFFAIGERYGAGDGATTFALPDCRGRVTAMPDGGTDRLSTLADQLGAVGGSAWHTLNQAEMPQHYHVTAGGNVNNQMGNQGRFAFGDGTAASDVVTSSSGGSSPHNNTQPTILFNKIIKR